MRFFLSFFPSFLLSFSSSLVDHVVVQSFVEARATEMHNMKNMLTNQSGHLRVFQTVPRHLRRRAASYNIKRLPVRLRLAAIREAKKDEENNCPRKEVESRRRRRRPAKILCDYTRRQRKNKWLETHIWHAKRMKMKNFWGYRLALHPSDKSVRGSYKTLLHSVGIHDSSYISCLQLAGQSLEQLTKLFLLISDPSEPSPASKRYLDGTRFGTFNLYEAKKYPEGFIANVQFLWKPNITVELNQAQAPEQQMEIEQEEKQKQKDIHQRVIWIWIHPSAFQQAFDHINHLIQTFAELAGIELKSLQGELNRFEITGPRAHAVFNRIVKVTNENDRKSDIWKILGALRTSASLPKDAVIGLSVYDPRLNFSGRKMPKRGDPSKDQEQKLDTLLGNWLNDMCESSIWDEQKRKELKDKKLHDSVIDARRAQSSNRGDIPVREGDSQIGILLLRKRPPVLIHTSQSMAQQTGKNFKNQHLLKGQTPRDFGTGWTLILPAGWAIPFWKSLTFSGCRPLGLREQQSESLEKETLWFPQDYPDCKAHIEYTALNSQELKESFNKKPPAKRPNYAKLKVDSPFSLDLTSLIQIPNDSKKLWVIRGQTLCENFNQSCLNLQTIEEVAQNLEKAMTLLPRYAANNRSGNSDLNYIPSFPISLNEAFIMVSVKLLSRGTICENGLVYIPTQEQYVYWQKFLTNKYKINPSAQKPQPVSLKDGSYDKSLLIGRITSGGFSYLKGNPMGIAACHANSFFALIKANKSRNWQTLVMVRKSTSLYCWPAVVHIIP